MRDEPQDDVYAVVVCHGDSVPGHCCGKVDLTEEQHIAQMSRPDSLWCCPNCGSNATFDDSAFERIHGMDGELTTSVCLDICEDCPPPNWPTDETRCSSCPRATLKAERGAV